MEYISDIKWDNTSVNYAIVISRMFGGKFELTDEDSGRVRLVNIIECSESKPLGRVPIDVTTDYFGVVNRFDLSLMDIITDTHIYPQVIEHFDMIKCVPVGCGYFVSGKANYISRFDCSTILGHLNKRVDTDDGFYLYFEDSTLIKYDCDMKRFRAFLAKWKVMNNGVH